MDTFNRNLLSAGTINGTVVENRHGERIGDIKELVIDTITGEVSYAVLAVDTGFLNLGSKYFAIPLQTMEFDKVNERIVIDISKERLENSPGFDKDLWPSGPQTEFIDSIYDFYEVSREGRYAAAGAVNRDSHEDNAASRSTREGFRRSDSHIESRTESSVSDYDRSDKNHDKSIH